MVGSLFAGREESPGDVVRRRGQLFKVYRGMASRSAAAARLAIEGRGDSLDQYVAEGEEMEFPLRGSVAEVVDELHGGLRSGMSYVDAASIAGVLGEGELRPPDRGRRAGIAPGLGVTTSATTLYANGVIVTMDDARHRARERLAAGRRLHDRGGRLRRRAGRRRSRVDLQRRRRHAGTRQYPPPPLPDPHPGPGAGGRPLHLAARAVPGLVTDRRGGGVRRGTHRPRGARALRLHDGVRPPLRLPAGTRGADRGRGAGRTRDRRADRRLTRVDGSRRLRRRPSARRAGRGHRRRARRDRAPRRRCCTSPAPAPGSSSPSHRARRSPSPGA